MSRRVAISFLAFAVAAGLGALLGEQPTPGQGPVAAGSGASSGPATTASGAASQPATAAAKKRVRVDRAKRQVIVPSEVQLQDGMLEFVLCGKRSGKGHETLLFTDVPPSTLHAALLALGLMPGRPGRWTTPPGGDPVFEPPQGARLEISLRWKDANGQAKEVPASEWMLTAGENPKTPDLSWVFAGSAFLDDGRYWADVEGMHICVANFAASVVDVPFESTEDNAFLAFACNPKAIPPKGTPVDVVITVPKGQERAPVARIGLAVDQFGRIELDGRPIPPEDIGEAVKKFLSDHAKGMAEVRMDARALVYDRERLKRILADAGLIDVTFRTQPLVCEVLPRTAEEAQKAIAWWKWRFEQADELVLDPTKDVQLLLKHIQQRREHIEAASQLWGDYADQLQALLAEHSKKTSSTQPDKP